MIIINHSKNLTLIKRVYTAVSRKFVRVKHIALVYFRFLRLARLLLKWKQQIKHLFPNRKLIGIHLTEHMGDITACEPITRYLKSQYPDAFLVWLVRDPYVELLKSNPKIDLVLTVSCLTEGFLIGKSLIFDHFFDLHVSDKTCPCCRFTSKHGNTNITMNNYYSYGSLLPVFCECAGLPRLEGQPRVYISSAAVSRVDSLELPSKYIAIHCTANVSSRDWRNEDWKILVDQIVENTDLSVVEIGLKPIVESRSAKYRSVCGELSILETSEVIKRAVAFAGIDSGPANLANAVETPGIILLGPYNAFASYLPYTGIYADPSKTKILFAKDDIKDITVEEVYQSIVAQITFYGTEIHMSPTL